MRKWIVLAAVASLVAGSAPAGAAAQKPVTTPAVSKGHKEHEGQKANAKRTPKPNKSDKIQRVSSRRGGDDRDDDVFRGSLRGNGNGPKFCRTGEGHPVHGRQWCVQKGFGLGNASWDRASWEDVVFRAPQRTNLQLGRGGLLDVLGDVVLNRLDARRRTFGIATPLSGRWLDSDDRSVLLITAGGVPLAELVDGNRDRRAELVLLNFRR